MNQASSGGAAVELRLYGRVRISNAGVRSTAVEEMRALRLRDRGSGQRVG